MSWGNIVAGVAPPKVRYPAKKPITSVIAPAIAVVAGLAAFAVIPVTPTLGVFELDVGLLFFLGVGALATYGALLGGWASNSKYSALGGLRAAAQMISYEVSIGFIIVGVILSTGSPTLATQLAGEWVFWKTGNVDSPFAEITDDDIDNLFS